MEYNLKIEVTMRKYILIVALALGLQTNPLLQIKDGAKHWDSSNISDFLFAIKNSIKKGVEFLANEQLEWGEFATYFSIFEDMEYVTYCSSIFITTFVQTSAN